MKTERTQRDINTLGMLETKEAMFIGRQQLINGKKKQNKTVSNLI